jgi:pimeloyl-ACP methyl ester carboxylesterase
VAPDLPYDDPRTTYAERAQHALDSVAGVADPVVVAHSLGAGYAPLVADARPGSTLVYLCPAPVGPFTNTGAPMRSSREGFEFPPNRPDGNSVWDPATAIAVMYPRLPADVGKALAARLKPGSAPSDPYPLSAQPAVPTSLIYATYDEFFDPAWSRWMAREVAGVDPIELETGHFAMLEAPDDVAGILLQRVSA